ncbi:phage major capsid protein [Massilia sp. DD77]|uniref:phage major capsid protein n=1 Tax=Massilia sp. DD77 TaxID=3109349 RepID=UPI002FFE9743
MQFKKLLGGRPVRAAVLLGLAVAAVVSYACGVDLMHVVQQHGDLVGALSVMGMTGEMDVKIMDALGKVESKLDDMSKKSEEEIKNLGKVSNDTKTAIENLGVEQRTLADRLVKLEQRGTQVKDDEGKDIALPGQLFVKSEAYTAFMGANAKQKVFGEVEMKNTVTNAIANTFSERRPGLVEGAFRVFTLEQLLTKIPTSANSVEWVRENVFTNAAGETAEGTAKPQSSITFTPGVMPVSTISHFLKITTQMASDNAALAAYINRRMIYGVNLRAETQIFAGNGVGANMSGLALAGNFTPHGYTAAGLTALDLANNRFSLIGKMIGDCAAADYPADVVVLNTVDWWTMRLTTDAQGRYILGDPGSDAPPRLFGVPVVASNSVPAGNVWVGSLAQAATLHDRENVGIALSDSDGDNFQSGLITIRADRRLALTVEKPAAARYGALKPA